MRTRQARTGFNAGGITASVNAKQINFSDGTVQTSAGGGGVGPQGPPGPAGPPGPQGATGPQGSAGIIPIYSPAGALEANQHAVVGSVTIPSGKTINVTFSGAAAFLSATSYITVISNITGDQATVKQNSGTSLTITGMKVGDVVNYICIGG